MLFSVMRESWTTPIAERWRVLLKMTLQVFVYTRKNTLPSTLRYVAVHRSCVQCIEVVYELISCRSISHLSYHFTLLTR